MNENCRECVQIENLKEGMESVKSDIKTLYGKINDVEKTVARKEEQIDTIFNMLKEIKGSIDKIGDRLESINKNAVSKEKIDEEILKVKSEMKDEITNIKLKPVENYSKTKQAIVNTICSTAVGTICGFILSKIIK